MGFVELSIICIVAVLGPLLALPRGWHLPVILGELTAGLALGRSGFGYLKPEDPTFTFLADIGFALVMFAAGSHVPVKLLKGKVRSGVTRAATVGILAAATGFGVARAFDLPHAALYAVLMASSSAAVIMPVVESLELDGPDLLTLLPQVAVADAACIVALPLVIDPAHVERAALGAASVIVAAAVVFLVLRVLERRGIRDDVHDLSEERHFALELRIQLALLFALAALAVTTHVSIMLAGFAFGLGVAAIGTPRRLAHQLFALTEGFLGPIYFVWLGATLNVRELGQHPQLIGLGVSIAVGAAVVHSLMRVVGQPVPYGMLAAAQLGIPVAAATVGTQLHVLVPGEASALMLGSLLTIGIATVGGALAARTGDHDKRHAKAHD